MNILKSQLNSPFTYLSFSLSCVCVCGVCCVWVHVPICMHEGPRGTYLELCSVAFHFIPESGTRFVSKQAPVTLLSMCPMVLGL